MAQFTAEFWQDLRKPMRDRYGGAVLYTGNAQANVLTVHLTENGEPYTGGGTISGTAIRANSTTVPLTDGSISADGTITVTLIPNCYLVAGYLHVYINVTTGSTVTTILSVIYSVNATSSGTPIDPSGEITLDVNTLVNRINTATATIPASYETLMYSVAPAYTDLDFPIDAGLQLCWYDGQLYVNNVDIAAAESWTPAHWDACDVSGELAAIKSDYVKASEFPSIANGTAKGAIIENLITGANANAASGLYSHAEGAVTTASGLNSHAEGHETTASGERSHAEGQLTTASGKYSHAEGATSVASGNYSHAEGTGQASGLYSHAEGRDAYAIGTCGHAEGFDTKATGNCSHAEGSFTSATHKSQHVMGEYNVEDDSEAESSARGNYAEIVGNGTANDARSNARTLDWSGNEALSGDLTINKNGANEMTVGQELSDLKSIVSENTPKIDASYIIATGLSNLDLSKEYNLVSGSGWEAGAISTSGGIISNSNVHSDYIPISPGNGTYLLMTSIYGIEYSGTGTTYNTIVQTPWVVARYCFYDADKNVIEVTADTNAYKSIPNSAAYVRVTISSADVIKYARLIYGNETTPIALRELPQKTYSDKLIMPRTGYEGFTMVCFGDSITHGLPMRPNSAFNRYNSYSYVDYANEMLHANLINVGFGGTRMATLGTGTGIDLFGFWSLSSIIVSDNSNKWDALDAYVETAEGVGFAPHLAALKAVDWSKVDAISILYGANDYNSEQPIYGSYDESVSDFKSYFDIACYYGLKTLLTKYPHLQILLITPFDRYDRDNSTDSSLTANGIGKYMYDYADSLKNLIVPKFKCPVLDWNKMSNINSWTQWYDTTDGTHPFTITGLNRLGKMFASAIQQYLYYNN